MLPRETVKVDDSDQVYERNHIALSDKPVSPTCSFDFVRRSASMDVVTHRAGCETISAKGSNGSIFLVQ